MAMVAGTITVNPTTGAHTGTGMALAVIDAMIAAGLTLPDPGVVPVGVPMTLAQWQAIAIPALVATKDFYAQMSVGIATGVVNHITANAEVSTTVGVADAGLQRDSTLAPTFAPLAPVTLATPGTIS